MRRALLAMVLLGARAASAQPAPPPPPTSPVDDPKVRAVAQALMTEGVRQLNARAYDQALANFLEAYAKLPSPRILLDIGSTLRDMGRAADAANTYQRYLRDPGTGTDRVAEVQQLLAELDLHLTLLTIHVTPADSELSIDGGPFLAVGTALVTRVRPGIHLVRIQRAGPPLRAAELTINGFEGEAKDVAATLPEPAVTQPQPPPPVAPRRGVVDGRGLPATGSAAEGRRGVVDAWLSTGTTYSSGGGNDRRVRSAASGDDIEAILPAFDPADSSAVPRAPVDHIGSGVLAMTRIDGRGRGVAAGFGLELAATDRLELELAVLRSEQWGAYVGARYRLLTGPIRPYAAVGMPVFIYDDDRAAGDPNKVSFGFRVAGGLEIKINGHLSVQGDLGYERFYHLAGTSFDPSIFVPTLAVIGRL